MKTFVVLLAILFLSGCSMLQPAGEIQFTYGDIVYTSTKDVDVTLTKGTDGSISITVSSSATNPITAQSQANAEQAVLLQKFVDKIPEIK